MPHGTAALAHALLAAKNPPAHRVWPSDYPDRAVSCLLAEHTHARYVILWAHGGGCVVSAHVRVMLCVVVIIPTLGRACKRLGERPAL